jgi:parkin
MSFIFSLLKSVVFRMLELIWFGKRKISNSLSIYVKTNTGNTLAVDLDPKWDIRNVKEIVAPKMGISPDDIKIIFAGKELHNSIIIEVFKHSKNFITILMLTYAIRVIYHFRNVI